ncbi:MAG: peptide chain release factor 1 [SAR202 cluster bacterium]|nr:peptide chain release factor 1 [Chloroflexota bacterium]MQG17750.1 peptide chain release factor 1 [SAR202 cluster bacterium]MQG35774.1 peptide chain release factor 1 [SAR202 cluster bacterium]MQG86594.1 peptide chain release factor 1 [SAR202 cluster bacterium]|tara:strand:- start:6123 stop:7202 length:1080 start_codon:yes stop_codon:yes gene_type:complete
MPSIFDKLEIILQRNEEIETLMATPEIASDFNKIQGLAKERSSLENLVNIGRTYDQLVTEQKDLEEIAQDSSDAELSNIAKQELSNIADQIKHLADDLELALLPKDPNDERDVIVEIRAGTGGREATLFAADLFRTYTKYAQLNGWKTEIMDSHNADLGGYNKIVFDIHGQGVYSKLKFEKGVHRVQRIPETETQGRIHTSTATVAVLPEADDVEINISQDDLRVDIFHSGGHGGQNVNKVATAVRIVHNPTGIVVVCQDERSQYKNKTKAMSMLRAKIYEVEQQKHSDEISKNRREQVGSAERSEKIRTYNFPQDRITDHRISSSFYGLNKILDGNLDEIITSLMDWERASLMEEVKA